MAWMSIMGLNNYDPTIFDGLNVPEGVNKDNVVNNILLTCAELEVIYSNPTIMKLAINVWSDSNQLTWNKLYKTMTIDYNPIWNVDADITEIREVGRNRTESGDDNRTIDLHDNETINTHDNETVNLTDTESVQGFNSSTWAEAKKNVKTGTDNIAHSGTDNIAHTGTDRLAHDIEENENIDESLITHRTGNIGVTTTQQMLEQERAIAEFNMIEYITKSFKERFCLMIY